MKYSILVLQHTTVKESVLVSPVIVSQGKCCFTGSKGYDQYSATFLNIQTDFDEANRGTLFSETLTTQIKAIFSD
jgi:hypothetical protein